MKRIETLVHELASTIRFTSRLVYAACLQALPRVYTHRHETVLCAAQRDRVQFKLQEKYKSGPPCARLAEKCVKKAGEVKVLALKFQWRCHRGPLESW
jgi:hypothetical protein